MAALNAGAPSRPRPCWRAGPGLIWGRAQTTDGLGDERCQRSWSVGGRLAWRRPCSAGVGLRRSRQRCVLPCPALLARPGGPPTARKLAQLRKLRYAAQGRPHEVFGSFQAQVVAPLLRSMEALYGGFAAPMHLGLPLKAHPSCWPAMSHGCRCGHLVTAQGLATIKSCSSLHMCMPML